MDYQEKLRLAKEALDSGSYDKETIEYIFPELKQSEDEEIRKQLIDFIEDVMDLGKDANFNKYYKSDCAGWIAWLKKQGEQKPTNKVEPKFNVGDWIVQENIGTFKVIKICESWYEVIDGEDNHYSISFDKEFTCHLWTIQDAKDGDVLVAKINEEPNNFIYIFKKYDQDLGFWSYCHLDTSTNKFHKGIYNYNVGVPATKEQCHLLLSKMKEAGYEWDAEKKGLKKIEQESVKWGEEDEMFLDLSIENLTELKNRFGEEYGKVGDCINWLKSLEENIHLHLEAE